MLLDSREENFKFSSLESSLSLNCETISGKEILGILYSIMTRFNFFLAKNPRAVV